MKSEEMSWNRSRVFPDLGLCVAVRRGPSSNARIAGGYDPQELAKRSLQSFRSADWRFTLRISVLVDRGRAKKADHGRDAKFAHLHDTTMTDFALKNYAASDTVDILNRIHLRTLATLANYSDSDLDTIFTCDEHPDGFEGSLRWILHHLVDHESNHRGQMAMIKRIIRSR